MKIRDAIIVATLFLATLLPIVYKTVVLDLDFFPTIKQDVWEIEFALAIPADKASRHYRFAVPEASERLKILKTQFEGKHLALTIRKALEGTFAELRGKTTRKFHTYYRVHIHSEGKKYKVPKKDSTRDYPKKIAPFLQPIPLSPELEAKVKVLEGELLSGQHDKVRIAKTLYYFIYEEIIRANKRQGLEQTITHFRGSARDKADLFTILARRQGIPARTIRGFKLIPKTIPKRKITSWNEVYLGERWLPVLTLQGYFGEIPDYLLPLYTSIDLQKKNPEGEGIKLITNAEQLSSDRFSALQYRQELVAKDSLLLTFSPYLLPLAEQPVFKLLLLFAFGTVILAICRTMIGIKSFGIFFPILLALFYKATSLWFGLAFFAFVVLLGVAERKLLQKMHLLAIPRFSIILTLLIITLLLFAILNNQFHFSPHNPAILPIIITTMFIERFSIAWEEEGTWNTLLALVGTLLISLSSYGLFAWKFLERLLYTHPECLFAIIATLILIGKYTGYRVSELIRFRELVRRPR